jgi:hypothetical protein
MVCVWAAMLPTHLKTAKSSNETLLQRQKLGAEQKLVYYLLQYCLLWASPVSFQANNQQCHSEG